MKRALELREGHVVVELGAGRGPLVPWLSEAVGPSGRVVAMDVRLADELKQLALPNVEVRQIAADEPGLAPASVDRVVMVGVWHHLADRVAYGRKLRAALRAGGRVVVVDSDHGPLGMSCSMVVEELRAAGFVAREVDEAPPRQFVVVAE